MIDRRGFLTAGAAVSAAGILAACAKKNPAKSSGSDKTGGGTKQITLGFSQVGSESGWRAANTQSVKEAAKAAGINLKFSDAQQKQENQISAIRSYIAQKVDVISFSPVVVTGWDTVLKEAKAAGIPVILTDRSVETSDASLYVTLVGSDFEIEGSAPRTCWRRSSPATRGRSRSRSWRAPPAPPRRSSGPRASPRS